ncbi:MAG: hypothetical protein ACI4RV_09920, partial [Eubacteriales bacterium]
GTVFRAAAAIMCAFFCHFYIILSVCFHYNRFCTHCQVFSPFHTALGEFFTFLRFGDSMLIQ